jgi:hypothetical protein
MESRTAGFVKKEKSRTASNSSSGGPIQLEACMRGIMELLQAYFSEELSETSEGGTRFHVPTATIRYEI